MTRENKILQLIEKLTENSGRVEEVIKSGNEFYFRYMGHVFSIMKRSDTSDDRLGEYGFYIYPNYGGKLANLVESFEYQGDEPEYSHFDVKDFEGDVDAHSVFGRLYRTFQMRGVDQVIDDILGTE
jgi:hypothetical protein